MSYLLDSINQIRFPAIEGPFGLYQLIINRPGYTGLTIAAANTLQLSIDTDPSYPDRVSPHLMDEIPLSKKFTTTVGRRALDDAPIAIRDSIGYSGYVNSVFQSEQFDADFLTFFDVWFQGTKPYQALIQAVNFTSSGNVTNISHMGWIDPTYNPSTDADVLNPGTTSQIWIGTRTIKVTALSQAQTLITWRNVLLPYNATTNPNVPSSYTGVTASDCKNGVPYNGFMQAPPNCSNLSNSRNDATTTNKGSWYQAVSHIHKYSGDPVLVALPDAMWPSTPWLSDTVSGTIASVYQSDNPADTHMYAVGDRGTIAYSSTDPGYTTPGELAVYEITFVNHDALFQFLLFNIISGGSQYAVDTGGSAHATTATTGSGTGLLIQINKVMSGSGFGPSGCVFISIGTVFAKIAEATGLDTFTPSTDLKSALDFFLQKASISTDQQCFPLDTTALPLDELYICLNVFAGSHPYDGSYWDNPIAFGMNAATIDVVTGICNFMLSDFSVAYSTGGVESLALRAMGETTGSVPASWEIIGAPTIEDSSQNATNVQVSNTNDNLVVQCPVSDKGSSTQISIPIRLHKIGVTSGIQPFGDLESILWDGTDPGAQADNCFKVAWLNGTGTSTMDATVNPDCWKGLCYLYWLDTAGTAAVYPSNWDPFPKYDGTAGSWVNAFYVVNACYKSGATPPADLMNAPQGDDYFNSRDYHAVAFAALTLLNGTVQTFQYAGISDDSGSVQAITSGMAGTWRLAQTASQPWRGIQVDQRLRAGTTTLKWQAVGSTDAFPELTDPKYPYGPISGGGTSSGGGGNTSSTGTGSSPALDLFTTVSETLSADTDDLALNLLPLTLILASSSAIYALNGIAPKAASVLVTIKYTGTVAMKIPNNASSSLAANRFITANGEEIDLRPGQTATFIRDTNANNWHQIA